MQIFAFEESKLVVGSWRSQWSYATVCHRLASSKSNPASFMSVRLLLPVSQINLQHDLYSRHSSCDWSSKEIQVSVSVCGCCASSPFVTLFQIKTGRLKEMLGRSFKTFSFIVEPFKHWIFVSLFPDTSMHNAHQSHAAWKPIKLGKPLTTFLNKTS